MSWEPLQMIKKNDPITLAKYAKEEGLLERPKWKWAKRYIKNAKKLNRMYRNIHADKKKKGRIKYKFGIRVPSNLHEAYYLDQLNGNTKWQDSTNLEIDSIMNRYNVFKVLSEGEEPPQDYEKIVLLWTFDVKFDLRHRSRLVAEGHLTEEIPSTAKKKHCSLAYHHRLREQVVVAFTGKIAHVRGVLNTSDVVSKLVGPAGYWNLLGWLLYYGRSKKEDRDHEIQGELQDNKSGLTGRTPDGRSLPFIYRESCDVESQIPNRESNESSLETNEINDSNESSH